MGFNDNPAYDNNNDNVAYWLLWSVHRLVDWLLLGFVTGGHMHICIYTLPMH